MALSEYPNPHEVVWLVYVDCNVRDGIRAFYWHEQKEEWIGGSPYHDPAAVRVAA